MESQRGGKRVEEALGQKGFTGALPIQLTLRMDIMTLGAFGGPDALLTGSGRAGVGLFGGPPEGIDRIFTVTVKTNTVAQGVIHPGGDEAVPVRQFMAGVTINAIGFVMGSIQIISLDGSNTHHHGQPDKADPQRQSLHTSPHPNLYFRHLKTPKDSPLDYTDALIFCALTMQ